MNICKLIDKWIRFLISFYCFISILSCQPTEQDVFIPSIEADITSNAELKLSDYFDNFRMFKLPSDTLMGEIERINYENNRIYISDERALFVFSKNGELLSYIERTGNGPGEYATITDFTVDGETIVVLDREQRQLITYDHFGKCIATRTLYYDTQALSPVIDNAFFIYNSMNNSHKLRRIRNGQEDSLYVSNKNQAEYLFIFAHHNFYQDKKSVYFFQPVNDTVYLSSEGGGMTPSFYVDFKGKNIPPSFMQERYSDVKDFFDQLYERPYAYGVYSFAIYDRFLMFGSFYKREKKLTVFDRRNKISNTFATIRDDVYFNGLTIPVSRFIYHADEEQIIVPVDAFSVAKWKQTHTISEQFKEIVDATKEDDNPLLLIFDPKQ